MGPNKNPAGFIRKTFAFPKPVVWIVPKMFEILPPVTRPRMFEVGSAVSLRKLAILFVGTLKLPKLWNRLVPPPGLLPPVMLYRVELPTWMGLPTTVFSPDEVMGAV